MRYTCIVDLYIWPHRAYTPHFYCLTTSIRERFFFFLFIIDRWTDFIYLVHKMCCRITCCACASIYFYNQNVQISKRICAILCSRLICRESALRWIFFFVFFFVDASLAQPKKLKIIYQSWQMNLFKFQVTYVREREKGFFGHQKTMRCANTEYLSFKVGIQLMCINSHMCVGRYMCGETKPSIISNRVWHTYL